MVQITHLFVLLNQIVFPCYKVIRDAVSVFMSPLILCSLCRFKLPESASIHWIGNKQFTKHTVCSIAPLRNIWEMIDLPFDFPSLLTCRLYLFQLMHA